MSQSEDEESKRREAEKVERVRLENLQTIKEWHRTAGEREEAKAKAETDAQERRKAQIREAIETTERIEAWLAAPYDGSGALKFSGLGNPPTWFPDFHQERCLEIQKRIFNDPNFTPRNSPAQLRFWMECREWPHIDQVPIEYREAVAYLNMLLDAYLLGEFDGSKILNRPAHRLADCLGVVGVVLVALHVRLHKLRGNQLHPESLLLQLARPVMRATARLHADLAIWLDRLAQHLHPVLSRQPPAPERLLLTVYAVHLKYVLCQINPYANKLHGGPLLLCDWWITLPVWHFDAD